MYLERYAHAFNPPVPSSAEILKKHLVKILTFWIFPSVLRHQTKRRLRHLLGMGPAPETLWEKHVFEKRRQQFLDAQHEKNIYGYKIVSLGCDCFSRTIPTLWGIKPRKKQGEKGCPFDLSDNPLPAVVKYLETISKAISTLWLTTNSLKAGGLQMMKSFTVMKTTAPKHPAALSPNALPAELTTCGKFYIKTPDRHCSSAISIRCWLPQTSTKQNNCIIVCIKHCKLRAAKEVFG